MIRESDQAKRFVQRLEAKHGKPHALAVLRARIGRTVYTMLKRREPFDLNRFFAGTGPREVVASASSATDSSSLVAGSATPLAASGS